MLNHNKDTFHHWAMASTSQIAGLYILQNKETHFDKIVISKNLAPAEISIEVDFRSPSATAAWRREPPWPPYWQFTASLKMSLKDN